MRATLLWGLVAALMCGPGPARAEGDQVDSWVAQVEPKVVAWYRDLHAHPELGNQERRTAGAVASHLKRLDFDEVRTGIAHTGVVGVLRGNRAGPVVALRADMDALPMEEKTGLPYASRAKGVYRGRETFLMHACGHDAHTAMLMGAAEVLSRMKAQLAGTVVFVFQPSEEERPNDEPAGAELMIEQGALADPSPSAIFGLHVYAAPPGEIGYVPGPIMAAQETFHVLLKGRATHGSTPWNGVDLIPLAGEIVSALGRIPSSQVDLLRGPTVLSVGRIRAGDASNIIPGELEFEGTMRSLDEANRKAALAAIERTVNGMAAAAGAEATLTFRKGYPITFNNPGLTARMLPVLRQVAGDAGVRLVPPALAAEDFSYFQQNVPGVYFFLGINKADARPEEIFANHSDRFAVNEAALRYGVEAHVRLALSYLASEGAGR